MDRQREADKLNSGNMNYNKVNQRDTLQYSVGNFVLRHRNSQMHISKSEYNFLAAYEILMCLSNDRCYEIRKVVTKASNEQLRSWSIDSSISCDMHKILDYLDSRTDDGNNVELNK